MLNQRDQATLEDLGLSYRIADDGGFLIVVVDGFPMPTGIEPASSCLLLRLPPGFPDAAPDMFWLDPGVRGSGGAVIPGTEATQEFVGRIWQRWSRHIQGQWRPGIDNLSTYFAYIRRCLDHAGGRVA